VPHRLLISPQARAGGHADGAAAVRMVNTDKVKAARGGAVDIAAKRQAIANAQRKKYEADRRLRAAHRVAAVHEDSARLPEHELAMLEQRQKREAKAAKSAAFRARVEQACDTGCFTSIDEPTPAPVVAPRTPQLPTAAVCGPHETMLQVGRHTVMRTTGPGQRPTDEEVQASVASLVASRRQASQRGRAAESSAGRAGAAGPWRAEVDVSKQEAALDTMLAEACAHGILSEAQIDRVTDALAMGRTSARECLDLGASGLLNMLQSTRVSELV
jgi:hypothetical protein